MHRLWDEHICRKTMDLNGSWLFRIDPENCGESERWFDGLKDAQNVTVPSVWNTQMGLLEYEGAAWYEKRFYTTGGCLRFCFGAVLTQADVWLDGKLLGSHYGGFCQFELLAEQVEPGWHKLTVRADNRFDDDSIPQATVDWYHYGGISRDVSVETMEGVCVLYERMEYALSDDLRTARAHFVLEAYNASAAENTSVLRAELDGQCVYEETLTLSAHEMRSITTPEFTVDDVRLWSVEEPNLYDIVLSTDTDDLRDRTGLRRVEILGQQVAINGKTVEIRGVNRHEEHPDWGFAFPPALMQRDLDIAAQMGCNAIRGSHYPNSQMLVDLLDGRGMLFWSEIPIWGVGFTAETLANPVIVERGLQMHREMVRYYYNHPSIVFWGMHNEIPSQTQPAWEMSKIYYHYLKEHGGNRIVTYACNHPFDDICGEFCDLLAINWYNGWYQGNRDTWGRFLNELRLRRKELGLENKPVILSEFGAAAIYGHHTFDDQKWTEEYQANMLEICLNVFHEDPMVAGFFIWQFCDIRTSEEMGLNRARHFNNKGLLNEYRRPKMAYHLVKKLYKGFAEEC